MAALRSTADSPPRRIGIAELEARLCLHRNTIAEWYKSGRLPKPHYIGELRRWWLHEIEAWEAEHTSPSRSRKRQGRRARARAPLPTVSVGE
jgi:predicted DNA-binding transcriptional regulator AlpA